MSIKHFTTSDLAAMPRFTRTALVNSLSGFKSANLIGTKSRVGVENLAIFSSAVHIGADPALLGIVFRPVTADRKTSRHTYENIKETGFFTLNHVHTSIVEAAHQTSANYPDNASEFETVGLTPQYIPNFSAPFVQESAIKMGLEYVEEYVIKANNTIFLIGKIVEILLPEHCLDVHGNLDLNAAQTVTVSGLDTYHTATEITRLPYARPK